MSADTNPTEGQSGLPPYFTPAPDLQLPSIDEILDAMGDAAEALRGARARISHSLTVHDTDPQAWWFVIRTIETLHDPADPRTRCYWYHLLQLDADGNLEALAFNQRRSEILSAIERHRGAEAALALIMSDAVPDLQGQNYAILEFPGNRPEEILRASARK